MNATGKLALSSVATATLLLNTAMAAPVIFSDAGATPADIVDTVDAFKVQISQTGPVAQDNGLGGGPFSVGFRQINWDLVPTASAPPHHLMPGNFFNSSAPVGAVLTPLSGGLQVSAKTGEELPLRFGNIQPSYETTFQSYDGDRIFAPYLQTVTDVTFFVPGSPTDPAYVHGFGVVFTDVDRSASTGLQFYDVWGNFLGGVQAPVADNGLSFLGVWFDSGEQIARVRIFNGGMPLMPGVDDGAFDGLADMVALGPILFSEPLVIPEPGTAALMALGLVGLLRRRR